MATWGEKILPLGDQPRSRRRIGSARTRDGIDTGTQLCATATARKRRSTSVDDWRVNRTIARNKRYTRNNGRGTKGRRRRLRRHRQYCARVGGRRPQLLLSRCVGMPDCSRVMAIVCSVLFAPGPVKHDKI